MRLPASDLRDSSPRGRSITQLSAPSRPLFALRPLFQRFVAGHGKELVFGNINGKRVVVQTGRFHYYEGNSPATTALAIRVFAALGVRVVIITNAAGGINKCK